MINKVINTDCLDFLKLIPDNTVDLVIADPPYYLLNTDWDRKQWPSTEEYLSWCNIWLNECFRIMKPSASIYIFQSWQLVAEFVIMMKKIFPYFQNWITWERNKGRSSKINFKSSKEEILYFSKSRKPIFHEQLKLRPVIAPYRDEDGKPKGWWINEDNERVRWTGVGNVWHYTPPVWSSKEEKPFHPTQKPLMMLERIISASSNPGDLVLDLFSGSGVGSVVSKKLGRNFIAVEKDEKYYAKIIERLDGTIFKQIS